jgi:hypothetical protein
VGTARKVTQIKRRSGKEQEIRIQIASKACFQIGVEKARGEQEVFLLVVSLSNARHFSIAVSGKIP